MSEVMGLKVGSQNSNNIGSGVDITTISGETTLQQDSYVVCDSPNNGDLAACKVGGTLLIYSSNQNTSQLFVRKGTKISAWNAVGNGKILYYPII